LVTFGAVKEKAITVPMKLTAALLLALLLFIHLTQFLHTHEAKRPADPQSDTAVEKIADHCAICAYHFSKDTFLIPPTAFIISPEAFVSVLTPTLYPGRTISSVGAVYSDRGPPSFR
jgi:hypothetical protein